MSVKAHNDRDAILSRIRSALSHGTDQSVKAKTLALEAGPLAPTETQRGRAAPEAMTNAEKIDVFRRISDKLRTRVERVPDLDAAAELIRSIALEENWKRVGAYHDPMIERCVASTGAAACWTDDADGYDPDTLESCDAGISTCEALIAGTGSVLVTCLGNGGRALSVLPPHHVVIAGVDQLVPDLADGYRVLRDRYGNSLPSQITFITGPSRTGDIERILVLGAHGPKRLTVVLIDQEQTAARS